MHELSMDLAARHYGDEWLDLAAWYRQHALAVIDNPDRVIELQRHPLVLKKIDAEFSASTRQRAEMFEAMSYGDPSFLLTTPGPSLSGVLLQALGDAQQRDYFQRYVVEQRCRTFFAVTEPGKGSDAAHLECRLGEGQRLSGEKLLFGNGAVAPIGTALVRTGDGFLDMAAILLTPELLGGPGVTRRGLDMFAMHGAQLAYLRFEQVAVPGELILGRHLRPLERGMMAMLKTFHRFRPGVSAMAIGHGQALVDYARLHFAGGDAALGEQLDYFDQQLAQARALNLHAAEQVDLNPIQGALVSLAKGRATALAERIGQHLGRHLPPAALVEHPWLSKSLADVYAYEYMEGTTPIQLRNVYNGFRRNEFALGG